MDKGDAVGEGGVGNEGMRGLGWGEVKVPEAGRGCTSTGEQQSSVSVDVKAGGGEGGSTAVVAELADGNEGMGS
jgi:hypothetical protein